MQLATVISQRIWLPTQAPIRGPGGSWGRVAAFLLMVVVQVVSAIEETPEALIKRTFAETKKQFEAHPGKADRAWQFARACFDAADIATNNTERAAIAEQGISAARQAIAMESNSAPAHFYLGVNMGELAETKGLSALKLVRQMQHEFSIARDLDPHIVFAGPDRNLGLLYRDAPSIGSIGSRTKAREHLQHAVDLAPDFPENQLNLIEALVKWGEKETATHQLKLLKERLPGARAEFTGPHWTLSWVDWDARFQKLTKKLEQPSKALESPRQKQS
jgi:tetratricopeptide (TPR) repeat protein